MKNWKTTLFGLGAGVLQLAAGGMDWKHIGLAVATSLLGLFAKDHDQTGV